MIQPKLAYSTNHGKKDSPTMKEKARAQVKEYTSPSISPLVISCHNGDTWSQKIYPSHVQIFKDLIPSQWGRGLGCEWSIAQLS